ncbi:hypothetical protein BDV28DRAFT_39712 [Aspergillus coremiiformis]|uniref:Uncharacterized protein n=1 Tax=Aspergillus coremiiformis TaxID=138285 RepID=A0A5N6YYD4_9EURO|nr:hypothetical protein BDV28DRAFT_39712 [Aspergillus coremiiformis]
MNLGLFQMGKTSSPVRARREADLKFSEMKFLSNGAGKSLKATSIHRGEAESRNVTCRNTTNLNTEHSLSLLDTAGEQARRWVYDGEKETISIAHADASNKHQKEGNSGLSQVTTQYTWSESVRARSELEDPFEFYTRQLLKVNLDTPKNSEKVMTEGNLDKRYWSLEELKCLLEHRKSFWDSEANDSVMSKIQGLPSNSRKRKCSLSIEQKIPAQSGKVRGNNRIRNNADQYNAIGALTRSHHGSAPALTAHPRGSEGINVDPMQMIHRQPEPASSQMYGHADIIEPSTSEYMLYPGTSSFTGSSLQFQKPKSTVQSCRTSGLSEPKISTSSAMGLDYTKSLMHYANETVPLLGGKYALIEQALSAAYDVIMHPEQDPLHRLQENQEIETAMRSDPSDVRSKLKESIFPVADDSYGSGLPEDLSWAASDTEIFLHNSHDTAEQKPHLSLTQPNRQHLIGDFPETRRSARGSPGMRVVETVFRPTMTMVSGLQEEIVSGLKGFWRQQKLY